MPVTVIPAHGPFDSNSYLPGRGQPFNASELNALLSEDRDHRFCVS